jgi:hypothetical protein
MMRLGGPELKLPDLGRLKNALGGLRSKGSGSGRGGKLAAGVKAPDFLVDLYWDLRDRHLLPVVALAVVACVAAPILLGGGSGSTPSSTSTVSPVESVEADAHTLAVAQSEPGLREPSKRLRGLPSKDPFRAHTAGTASEGTEASGGAGAAGAAGGGGESATTVASTSAASGGGESAVTTTGSAPSGGAEGSSPGHSGSAPAPQAPSGPEGGGGKPAGVGHGGNGGNGGGDAATKGLTIYTFAIDVKITKTTTKANGTKAKPETVEKERVVPPAALPGKKSQVVTYMGISPTTHQPLFLVSEAVQSVFGETKCVAGEGRCQLVELEKGFPVTFVFGENNVRYKIEVLKVEPVTTGHS